MVDSQTTVDIETMLGEELSSFYGLEFKPLNSPNQIGFRDYNGLQCSIQQSSSAMQNCLWLGGHPEVALVHDRNDDMRDVVVNIPSNWSIMGDRMHLTQEQCGQLAGILGYFHQNGYLPPQGDPLWKTPDGHKTRTKSMYG